MNSEKPPTMNIFRKSYEVTTLTRNRMLRSILVILCLSLCVAIPTKALAGKGYRDPFPISNKAIDILKKHGLPVDQIKGDNSWFAISYNPRSITLHLYKAEEIPQQAVLDIVKLCMEFYEVDGRKGRYRIVMYRESREEWRKSLFLGIGALAKIKPYFELTIGRKGK